MSNWCEFFVINRLTYQFKLLAESLPQSSVLDFEHEVIEIATQNLSLHHPDCTLLHGDLWSGNAARCGCDVVVFDPAIYYGDRETDLAMMKLFGGFDSSVFKHYEQILPLPDGHQLRCALYQLYHSLNHMNIFGNSYESMTLDLIKLLKSN